MVPALGYLESQGKGGLRFGVLGLNLCKLFSWWGFAKPSFGSFQLVGFENRSFGYVDLIGTIYGSGI